MARYGSRASNLSGLLGSIGGTIGEMGKPGQQYIDTFRRSMAPKVDTESSQSMKDYSLWARRNGYDDEAVRYENMAIERGKVEAKQDFKKANQGDANELAKLYKARGQLASRLDSEDGLDDELLMPAIDNKIQAIQDRMNARGLDSEYGSGKEGTAAYTALVAAENEAVEHELKMKELRLDVAAKDAERMERIISAEPMLSTDFVNENTYSDYVGAYNALVDRYGDTPNMLRERLRMLNESYGKRAADEQKNFLDKEVPMLAKRTTLAAVAEIENLLNDDKKRGWFSRLFTDRNDAYDWLTDEDNQGVVNQIIEDVSAELAIEDPEFKTATQEERTAKALRLTMDRLKANPEFAKQFGEERADLDARQAGTQTRRDVQARDYGGPDYAVGGKHYKTYRAQTEAQLGRPLEGEELKAFNSQWEESNRPKGGVSSSPANFQYLRQRAR